MNAQNSTNSIKTIAAPWNKTVTLENVAYNGGIKFLRLRIKEGRRFTDLELDAETLGKLNELFSDWLAVNSGNSQE